MATIADLKQGQQQSLPAARQQKNIFDFLTADPKIEKAITAVATQFLTPDRFLRLAVNAVKKTPLLMECDPQTVLGSFMASAALGLEPNTVQQQAFLIPYKSRIKQGHQWIEIYECQFQVGYRGYITLAHRSPHIGSLQAEAIHERDVFDHLIGTESLLKYRKALKDRGSLIGAFAYSKLERGTEIATVLPIDDVYKIRARSEAYNALQRSLDEAGSEGEIAVAREKFAETPWVKWEDDMAAKSAIKKHAKQLPLMPGDAMALAVMLDTDGDGRIIDMAAMANPDVTRSLIKEGYVPEKEEAPPVGHQASPCLPAQAIRHPANSVTFTRLAERIESAGDADALDVEADLIGEIADAAQREELTALYRARREALIPPAKRLRVRPSGMNVE